MLTRIQFKERVHRKYDWILNDLKSHDKIALISQNLLDGIDACLKVTSDLPYFEQFYSDYFCVYSIDSIIDMAYALRGDRKTMCLTLIKSSLLYHQDKKTSLKKSPPKEEGKIIEMSDAYLKIRNLDEIWANDDKVIEYLVAHYAKEVKRLPLQILGYLTTRKDEKKLKRKYKNYNIKYEKYRFIKLLQRAQDAVLNESNTTVESVETIVSQTAEEIELNIADSPTITSKSKSNSNKVRTKEDINYSEQQAISQKIGDRGEELVLRNEIEKIKQWGLPDEILSKVRRVSLESDDYGFDILSFDKDGNERYLEVKTTKTNGKNFSFILTRNEFEHAKTYGSRYSFVIVFDILCNPRIWYMGNPFVAEPYKVKIQPFQYRVDVKTIESVIE